MAATDAEIATLASSHDIIQLGMLGDEIRRAKHGARTTFVRVADVDAAPGAPAEWPPTAGEIRITGAPADRNAAAARVGEIASRAGTIPVSGFSLADLEAIAAAQRTPLRDLLEELHGAGLELIADAPVDRMLDARLALEAANMAGLVVARLSVHQASGGDPVSLFQAVARLQRDVAIIRVFAPLAHHSNPLAPTTGYDDVKRVALARIIVDNVSMIQVDWSRYGPKLAQVALTVGADDIDAVSPSDDAPQGPRRAPIAEVRRNISAAGLEAIERNGRFDPVA